MCALDGRRRRAVVKKLVDRPGAAAAERGARSGAHRQQRLPERAGRGRASLPARSNSRFATARLAVGLDANHDGKVTWGELRAAQARSLQYVCAASAAVGTRTAPARCNSAQCRSMTASTATTCGCRSRPIVRAALQRLTHRLPRAGRGRPLASRAADAERARRAQTGGTRRARSAAELSSCEHPSPGAPSSSICRPASGTSGAASIICCSCCRCCCRRCCCAAIIAGRRCPGRAGVLQHLQGRDGLHAGAFDHAVAGGVRRGAAAEPADRVGDRRVDHRRGAQQRLSAS